MGGKLRAMLIVLLAGAGIAFGYFTLSPLFRTVTLNEELPSSGGTTTSQAKVRSASDFLAHIRGPFGVVPTTAHPARGNVYIVNEEARSYVRYEDYKTLNGPDLYVYLSKDLEAKDFVSLGPLRATEGSVNYEIPPGVDLGSYPYVLTWCKAFGVLFNSAKIN